MRASALWFEKMGAISNDDIELLLKLREHRNLIAHELPKVLSTVELDVNLEYFDRILYLVHKIDKWWIREIDIPTNPDFDDRIFTQAELDGVQSSRMIVMGLFVAMAKGHEAELRLLYESVKEEWERRTSIKSSPRTTGEPQVE